MAVKREFFMAFFRAIFCGVFCALMSLPAVADGVANDKSVSSVDPRKLVDWSDYKQIVHIQGFVSGDENGVFSACTGQYVSPNLILTAAHCIMNSKGDMYKGINVVTYAGKKCAAQQAFWVGNYLTADYDFPYDFAVLEIEPECYSSINYKIEVSDIDKDIDVYNVGFGSLTILSDAEIKKLRDKFKNLPPESQTNAGIVEQEFTSVLGRPIRDVFDNHKLKLDARCSGYRQQSDNVFYTNCYDWNGNSGGPIVQRGTNNLIGVMAGSNNSNYENIGTDEEFVSGGASTFVFEKWLSEKIKDYPPTQNGVVDNSSQTGNGDNNTMTITNIERAPGLNVWNGPAIVKKGEGVPVPEIPTEIPGAETREVVELEKTPGLSVDDIIMSMNTSSGAPTIGHMDYRSNYTPDWSAFVEEVEEEKEERQKELNTFANKEQTTDKEFVYGVLENVIEINRLSKLEEAYKNAKERESSLANRMLSGATIAATGLGGMELARGIAEQSVDRDAAADMAAYLATFQCKIGDNGNKINGGDMGITTPGANQLINLYQSYVDLAASVKARKADLGLRPGIEADVVLDKSATGLYDDKGNGVQNGTYASLYRASRGKETDAQKLAEQSDASTNRVQIGGAAAGVGAVGGAVGNVLINKDGVNSDQNILQQAAGLFLGK